jgi:hypothetical protein
MLFLEVNLPVHISRPSNPGYLEGRGAKLVEKTTCPYPLRGPLLVMAKVKPIWEVGSPTGGSYVAPMM